MKIQNVLCIGVLASLFTFILTCFFEISEIVIAYGIIVVMICMILISFFMYEIRNEMQLTRRIVIHNGLSDKDIQEILKQMLNKLKNDDES